MKIYQFTLPLVLLSLLLSSCQPSEDKQAEMAIEDYLETIGPTVSIPSSFGQARTFPAEVQSTDVKVAAYDKLHAVGLLSKESIKVDEKRGLLATGPNEGKVDGFKYDLTEEGKGYYTTERNALMGTVGKFKVGSYELSEVVNKTEPTEAMGFTIMNVKFTCTPVDIPDKFLKSDVLRKQDASESIKMDATLIKTDKGWMHEELWEKQ